jgi:hypothetical protein
MRNDIVATVTLIVFSFICLILAIAFDLMRRNLWISLKEASNITNVSSYTFPLYNSLETVFWMFFLIALIGGIVSYVVGSHEEENVVDERYRPPRDFGGFGG